MHKRLVALLFTLLFCSPDSYGQSVTYVAHDQIISNPERGFYHHTEVHSGGQYSYLDQETLEAYRTEESITQVLRVIYLEEFRDVPISDNYLNNIRKDLATVRKAGLKCIIRFAYSTKSTAPYNDATPEVVQTHIDQIKPILRENADVIAVMQAGFIGAWGEWYYTDHFASSPGIIDEDDWENRREVVYSLLDALTSNRMLQIRTPGYKMEIFDSQEALDESVAFSGSYASRLGHHNDCFVASSSDFGTYVNPDVEKPYLSDETFYTPMGGETCALASPYSDCDNSVSELERFHWSYLNIDYNAQVLNEWDDQGCFDEITLKLGYRYELLDGDFTDMIQPGGTFDFDLNLQNVGYSNPYNPREVEIILRNQSTSEEYIVKPDVDMRLWALGESIALSFSAGIPDDMVAGDYDLILNMPDPYATLHDDPSYSIQFANIDVWEATSGYNNLNHTVSISAEGAQPTYMGDQNFELIASASENLELDGASQIFGSVDRFNNLIYWGRQSDSYQRIIQRSDADDAFLTIASVPASQDYYLDADIIQGKSYTYRYYMVGGDGRTAYSNEVTLETNNVDFPSVDLDGSKADWGVLPISSSAIYEGEPYSMRVYFDAQRVNFLLEGNVLEYRIYMDTDNNTETGYQDEGNPIHGADYLISDEVLMKFSTDWVETEALVTSVLNDNIAEVAVDQRWLENLGNHTTVSMYAWFNNDQIEMSSQEGGAFLVHRNLPPDTPVALTVEKSELMPKSRLLLSWNECVYCDGYILERSIDQGEYLNLGQYDADITEAIDNDLEDETTYYYRLFSFNSLGKSSSSGVASGTTGERVLGVKDQPKVMAFPNPTNGIMYMPKVYGNITILSISGDELLSVSNSSRVDLSHLKAGIYLIKISSDSQSDTILKVIKQ